ncbi:MAG: flagellar basal body P-ring formation chaperone FlgA [Burkholderiales bacterium]
MARTNGGSMLRHLTGVIAAVLALAVAGLAGAAPAGDLKSQAKLFLDAQVLQAAGDVEIAVGEPDARLQLAPCARMEPFLPPNARLWGRSHIGVRCVEGANWTAYVPITVRIFGQVPVAARAIPRGQAFGPDDVRMERVEVTQYPVGEIATGIDLDGRVATRAITAGEPIRRSQAKLPASIHPGDAVRVVIETPTFVVSTEGKALTSAANGDGVQVALEGGKTVWGMANPGKVVQIR